jgi:L-ascorbate 6-phosphate lactonase
LKSIPRITKKNDIMFVGPRNVIKSLLKLGISREKICEVNVGDLLELESIKIRGTFCIPTDVTIYHTGDTGFHEFLFYLSKYPIDIMMVCINGGMGNMNIEEAVRLTRLLRPRVVIPNHYGMFAHNTDDPVRFRVRLAGTGAEAPCEILKMGEKYVYTRMES